MNSNSATATALATDHGILTRIPAGDAVIRYARGETKLIDGCGESPDQIHRFRSAPVGVGTAVKRKLICRYCQMSSEALAGC
jgi:hypothetical protein